MTITRKMAFWMMEKKRKSTEAEKEVREDFRNHSVLLMVFKNRSLPTIPGLVTDQETSDGVVKGKKLRLTVELLKLQLTQEQLKKLQRKNVSTKHENARSKREEESESNSNAYRNKVLDSSSQIVRESPVRHRLSNLLDGTVLSPVRDQTVLPEFCSEDTIQTNFNKDQLKPLTNPDSVKACLFNPDGGAADDNSVCFTQDEQCITVPCCPEVISKSCKQVDETSSGSDGLAADAVLLLVETANRSSKGIYEHHEERQSSKDNTVVGVSGQESEPKSASSSVNCAASTVSSGNSDLPTDNLVPGNEEAVPFTAETKIYFEATGDSGCSSADNSIDYASGYSTLEIVNSLLSDLNEETNRRIELDGRILNMEETNQKLLVECQKLKDMVNNLLQPSKVKGETVSRGTQINMDISLPCGRAVDRATSPLRIRDTSPDLELLSFSVGCQTNAEVEGPKTVSSLSQTEEEVIPPKILVSIACQTDVVMWPQARAAPQPSYMTKVPQMVRPNLQATTPLQHQNFSNTTQVSNVFHTAFIPSGQCYQLPTGLQFQQTSPFQTSQQVQSSAQVLGNRLLSSDCTLVQHPTTTGYQFGALSAALLRTSQALAGAQHSPASPTNHNKVLPLLERQSVASQGLSHPSLNAYLSGYSASQERNSVGRSAQTAVQLSQSSHQRTWTDGDVQAVARHLYSAQQQNNRTRSFQQTGDPQAALQSRMITGIESSRVNQTQQHLATAGYQATITSGQPNRMALQQGNSQQLPSRPCVQPLASQPQTQGHSEFRIQRNTILPISQYQQGNASTNQSSVHGLAMQPSLSQLSGLQTLTSARADSVRPQTCQSVNLNASMIQPVQQSVSQAMTVNLPHADTMRNSVPVSQSQATNLSFPFNQTMLTTQQSAQLHHVQPSVQARPSNTYDTIRQLTQATVKKNAQVSEKDLRMKPSVQSQSLFDEIRRVYGELLQSLDEITAKKQKEKNTEKANSESAASENVSVAVCTVNTTPYYSSGVVTTDGVTSVKKSSSVRSEDPLNRQANNLDKANSRTSNSPASMQITDDIAQGSSAGQKTTPLLSGKDLHRKPPKTPSGALESTVRRLLANQNSSSSNHYPRRITPSSVSDLFDGINSMESLQSETSSSGKTESQPRKECAGVCSGTLERDKVEVDSLDNCERTSRRELECQVNSSENIFDMTLKIGNERQPASDKTSTVDARMKETGDSLASEEVEKVVPISDMCAENKRDNNSDSVFIAPATPVKRMGNIEKDKDDLYIDLMSPVIPHGYARHRKDSDSEDVFVVPSSPVKTKDDNDKTKDDLYVNLMSPVIPVTPSASSKCFWSQIPQYNCDDSDTTNSQDEEQASDISVQKTESADKVTDGNPNQTEMEETVESTSSPDPKCTQTHQEVRNFDGCNPENEEGPELAKAGEEGNIDEDRVTEAELELPIKETQQDGTVTDTIKVAETKTVVRVADPKQVGDNADEGIEFTVGIEQYITVMQQTVTTVDSADPANNEIVRSVVRGEDSIEKEGKVGEDMEADAVPKNGMAETHQAVDSRDPCSGNDSVEKEDKIGEDMEADAQPKNGMAETHQAVDSGDPCSENDSKLAHSVGNAEESAGVEGNVVEEMEVQQEMSKSQQVLESAHEDRRPVGETGQDCGVTFVNRAVEVVRNVAGTDEHNHVVDSVDPHAQKDIRVVHCDVKEDGDKIGEENDSQLLSGEEARESIASEGIAVEDMEEMETDIKLTGNEDHHNAKEAVGNAGNVGPVVEDSLALSSGLLTTIKESSHMAGSTTCSSSKNSVEDKGDLCCEQRPSGLVKEITKQGDLRYHCSLNDSSAITEASSLADLSLKPVKIGEMKNQLLESRQEPKQNNGSDITGILVSSSKIVDRSEKENAVTSDSSQQHLSDGSTLPIPRIAVRLVDNDLMIMWDLPDNDKVSEIEYFELYSWSRDGQWFKISKIKALRLPMGCTLKNLVPGKMFRFRVRAVCRGGVIGPFSEPSSFVSL